MRRLAFGRLTCSLLAGLILTCWPQAGRAAEPERVKFDTYDQVEIHGTYYPGDAASKSPSVMILHALGGLWIATEWQRARMLNRFPPVPANRGEVEGQDIECAVWLTFSPHIGVDRAKFTLHPDSWLANPVRDKVPMCFIYGEQDTKGKG